MLATAAPVVLCVSCENPLSESDLEKDRKELVSLNGNICLEFPEGNAADSVHLLVYKDSGTKDLVAERKISAKTTTITMSEIVNGGEDLKKGKELDGERAYIVVAIANSRQLNVAALQRYDAVEMVRSAFLDDDPSKPLLSGTVTVWNNGEQDWELRLTPLFCRVVLSFVSNSMSNYVRLEDPRVFLSNVNSGAEILRQDGFRPVDLLDCVERTPLPCDVGLNPQYPGISLYAYPNDYPEATPGTPRTSVVLECEIKGRTCTFPVELPSLKRNGSVDVSIFVAGPDSYSFNVLPDL